MSEPAAGQDATLYNTSITAGVYHRTLVRGSGSVCSWRGSALHGRLIARFGRLCTFAPRCYSSPNATPHADFPDVPARFTRGRRRWSTAMVTDALPRPLAQGTAWRRLLGRDFGLGWLLLLPVAAVLA